MKKKKQHIDLENERYGLFMTEESFKLDVMYGRNYFETDNHQEFILHRINTIESKSHDLYGQSKAKDKVFLPPVKLIGSVNVDNAEQSYYGGENSGGITREDTGKLKIGIYLDELEEKQVEINRGDIVAYNFSGEHTRYYEVEYAENIVDKSERTIGGFKPYWKAITAVPVKEDVVPFINEKKY